MFLIGIAGGALDVGVGIGGAVAILGTAFIVRSIFAAPADADRWPSGRRRCRLRRRRATPANPDGSALRRSRLARQDRGMAPIPGVYLRRRFLAADLLAPLREYVETAEGDPAAVQPAPGATLAVADEVRRAWEVELPDDLHDRLVGGIELGCTPISRRSSAWRSSPARPWRRCATRPDRSIARTGTGPGSPIAYGLRSAAGLDRRVREHGSAAGRRRLWRRELRLHEVATAPAGRPRHHARGRDAGRVPVLAAARSDAGRMGHSPDHRHLAADAGRDGRRLHTPADRPRTAGKRGWRQARNPVILTHGPC